MNIRQKTIGIWGYGRVGSSAGRLFSQLGATVLVYDFQSSVMDNCPFQVTQSIQDLFAQSEYLLPSPGIDIRAYKNEYEGTWLTELDLFQSLFRKKIIAITGSVGKTTVTHLLTHALKAAGWRVEAAGNIGTPMFDMIEKQNKLDAIVLEVSSFQLEHAQSFAPELAIWTNLYPNHLDRHTTMKNYFLAKYNLLKNQTDAQQAIASLALQSQIEKQQPKSVILFFDSEEKPSVHPSGFAVNWLIVEKALSLLQVTFPDHIEAPSLAHRLEKVAEINGVTFINDSKSTTPSSTLAAIESLEAPRILLFLGGLSKGIDRSKLIKKLRTKSIKIFCFGKESQQLFTICKQHNIAASCHDTLDPAVQECMKTMQLHDIVLFSPAGSSFDEFQNYEERGNVFKKIVLEHK